jgi:hypothetical protein
VVAPVTVIRRGSCCQGPRRWGSCGARRVSSRLRSANPEFIGKIRDITGLHLAPPDKALVLAVDEKSQIQALARPRRAVHRERGHPMGKSPFPVPATPAIFLPDMIRNPRPGRLARLPVDLARHHPGRLPHLWAAWAARRPRATLWASPAAICAVGFICLLVVGQQACLAL